MEVPCTSNLTLSLFIWIFQSSAWQTFESRLQEPRGQHSLAGLQPLRDTAEATPRPGIYCTNHAFWPLYTATLIILALCCVCLSNWFLISASRPLHWSEQTHHSEGFSCPLQVSRAGYQSLREWGPHFNHGTFIFFCLWVFLCFWRQTWALYDLKFVLGLMSSRNCAFVD